MTILDDLNALTPAQYQIMRVAFQQTGGSITAYWDVRIYNADGVQLSVLHPTSQPDQALRNALVSWYQDSKTQFENATGLTEYVPPIEEPTI